MYSVFSTLCNGVAMLQGGKSPQGEESPHGQESPHGEKPDTTGSSMEWNMWPGFEGEGTYLIFNKASSTCISLLETSSRSGTDDWVDHTSREDLSKKHPESRKITAKALWAIDTSVCSLEPGKMVLFRSIKYPGCVLEYNDSDEDGGPALATSKESENDSERDVQKWLLQKQTWVESSGAT
ncbi:MAG: hypothetical protein Q9181_005648 [Wetmoreana brouardii]